MITITYFNAATVVFACLSGGATLGLFAACFCFAARRTGTDA